MSDLAVVVTDVCQFLIFYSDPKIVLVLAGQKKLGMKGLVIVTSTLILMNFFYVPSLSPMKSTSTTSPIFEPILRMFSFVLQRRGRLWICAQNRDVEKSISCHVRFSSHFLRMRQPPLINHDLFW